MSSAGSRWWTNCWRRADSLKWCPISGFLAVSRLAHLRRLNRMPFQVQEGSLHNLLVFLSSFSPLMVFKKRFNNSEELRIDGLPLWVTAKLNNAPKISCNVWLSPTQGTHGTAARDLSVRIGSRDLEEGGEVITVLTVINHPYFNSYSYDYDYALLKLSRLIVLDGVTKAIIPLPALNQPIVDSTYVLVSGWGSTRSPTESNRGLRGVIIPTMNQDKCDKIYQYDGGVTKQMVCAGASGKDSCNVSHKKSYRTLLDDENLVIASKIAAPSNSWNWQISLPPNHLSKLTQITFFVISGRFRFDELKRGCESPFGSFAKNTKIFPFFPFHDITQQVDRWSKSLTACWLALSRSEWTVPIKFFPGSTHASLQWGCGSNFTAASEALLVEW